jgi:hypothetical protein
MLNQLYRDDLKAKENILFKQSLRNIIQERSYTTLPKIGLKKTHSAPFKPSSNNTKILKVDWPKDKKKNEKGIKTLGFQNETKNTIIIDAETGNEIFLTTAKWNAQEGAVSLDKSTILNMCTGRLDIKNRMKSIKSESSLTFNDKNYRKNSDDIGFKEETSDEKIGRLSKYDNDSNDENYADQYDYNENNNNNNHLNNSNDINENYNRNSNKYDDYTTDEDNDILKSNSSVYNDEIDYIENSYIKSNDSDLNETAYHPLILQFLRDGPLTPMDHKNWSSRTNTTEMPLYKKKNTSSHDFNQNNENNNDDSYKKNHYDENYNQSNNIIDNYTDKNDRNNSEIQKPSTSISQKISNLISKKNTKVDEVYENNELYDFYFGKKLIDESSEVCFYMEKCSCMHIYIYMYSAYMN